MAKSSISLENARNEAEVFEDLRTLCGSSGFIHAIAYFCWRDNVIGYSGEEVTEKDVRYQYSHEKLLRTEISTLIGLMVQSDLSLDIPEPKILQSYLEQSEALLREMQFSLQKPWLEAFQQMAKKSSSGQAVPDPFSTAEGLREPIFYGAESAYNFQYEELAERKYSSDANWLISNKGFSISDAKLVAQTISKTQMARLLKQSSGMLKKNPNEWTFLPGFIFKIDEVAEAAQLSLETVANILYAFSVDRQKGNPAFNDLSSFNEINAAPIIQLDENTYVLLQVYSLLEAIYEAPFFWMLSDKSYAATASENRGNFGEQFLAERFRSVFGKANVFQNVDIYKGKQRYTEVDVLIIYGSRAIIVQAKSKRLTIEARKGNDLQLKSDFKNAIHDAYDQALQCSDALRGQEFKFLLQSGEEIEFSTKPTTIFPVCVVADHFPALAAQARQFLALKTNKVVEPPVVTDVFFIDALTEILGTPLQFLNFMALRAKADSQLLVNQELAILGYHLKHNLWLDEKYSMVNLGDDFTSSLDIAMYARRSGVPGERVPKGILTRFDGTPIGALISAFEAQPIPELVSLGLMFLQLSSNAATHINNGIKRLAALSAKEGKHHDFSFPHDIDNSGVTIHISPFPDHDAKARLASHCRLRKYDTKADAWYGLLLAPGTGQLRGALLVQEKWKHDPEIEEALKAWPSRPMIPLDSLSKKPLRRKTGRNERCLCGSGIKYKKCCLHNI